MSDALREAASVKALLDQALVDLAILPAHVARAPIAAMIGQAAAALDALGRTDPDDPAHLEQLAVARAAADAARALLFAGGAGEAGRPSIERLEAARRSLDAYEARVLDRPFAPPPRAADAPAPPAAFQASSGMPALHRLTRPRLVATVPEADPDEDDDALRANLGTARVSKRTLAAPDDPWRAQIRRLGRDALEEIGALGNLRRAEGDAIWSPALARFEDRILADLDALASLSIGAEDAHLDVPAEAMAYADDAFTIDPGRAFARALVLGCVAGDDTVRAAVIALRRSHPYTHDAQRSALSLGSNAGVDEAMRALALHDDPAMVRLALDVLTARGAAAFDVAAVLGAHPDTGVRRRAATCLARGDRAPAIALLGRMLHDERDDEVAVAAAESLAVHDLGAALSEARLRLEASTHPGWLRLLAVAGSASDAGRLAARLARSSEAAEALGWHGHPAHVDRLVEALSRALDEPGQGSFTRAAAFAIHRITGAAVTPDRASLAAFGAFWSAERDRVEPRRHRFGRPFTLSASLDELASADLPGRMRETLAIEVAIAAEGASRLDVHGWVEGQLAEIRRLRDLLLAGE